MATFLIGYDVEHRDPVVTRHFLTAARHVHEDLDVPCTLFIVGRTLRHSPDAFAALVGHPLFDLQQHTETHVLLKTVYQENERGVTVFRGGSPDEVRADVAAAQRTFADLLGFRPIGLTGPYNYYRGLGDRPDLVQIVYDEGIRFLRTWGRNEYDWQPTPFFSPFSLAPLGFPDVWEYGIHGWQDCLLRHHVGWANLDGYFDRLRADIDRVVAADGVFSYCQHDWSSTWEDSEMTLTRRILAYALEQGMRIVGYAAHYAEQAAKTKETANERN
ncbi:MAG: polysaccharide deacetylase family protein [Chloroflexi bacterium]|nr:polysaccharide deacetylase family protein [Chloroflexota bacterium]